jgi:hypothetical protein
MKAIFRFSTALFSLLLLSSLAHAQYYWVTPVFKQPYPVAPSPSNSGFYLVDCWGRLTGPHYYLVPPCPPFNGIRPTAQELNKQGPTPPQAPAPQMGMQYPHGMVPQAPYQPMSPMQPYQPLQPLMPMNPLASHHPAPGGANYPVHPFTRSPRDFFMWGEAMEEERARGNRPVPVP